MDHTNQSESFEVLPGGQLSLLPAEVKDDDLAQREYKQGVYSGAQLKESDSDKYMTVCMLLADGSMSQRQISRLTGCSRNLVSAISRQAADIEPLKQQIARRARNVSALCFERIEEMLRDDTAKLTLRDIGIIAGIATDKSQLLSGEATQRVETIDSTSGADDFERQFAQLQQADVDELPAMGCEAEGGQTKGGELAAPASVIEVEPSAADEQPGGSTDGQ